MPDLPEPTALTVTPGTVLVLRLPASSWDSDELMAAVSHLHEQTGAVVVALDADEPAASLSAVQRADAEAALAEVLFEVLHGDDGGPDGFQLLAARRKLDELARSGWSLIRSDQ